MELAGVDQSLIEAAHRRVGTHRRKGGHVQHRSHRTAATPDLAFATPHAAVPVEGCNAHQGSDLLMVQLT